MLDSSGNPVKPSDSLINAIIKSGNSNLTNEKPFVSTAPIPAPPPRGCCCQVWRALGPSCNVVGAGRNFRRSALPEKRYREELDRVSQVRPTHSLNLKVVPGYSSVRNPVAWLTFCPSQRTAHELARPHDGRARIKARPISKFLNRLDVPHREVRGIS